MPKRKLPSSSSSSQPSDEVSPKLKNQKASTIHSISQTHQPLPHKNEDGELVFIDYPNFLPNLTPEEIIRCGSFGGTYFRPIHSSVTNQNYSDPWKELPKSWFEGLDVAKQVSSPHYDDSVNKYGVNCGKSLEFWEDSGWIAPVDPYGWFQWYCRFYLGRRCSDDPRQISRGLGVMGPRGRWRSYLINKCLRTGRPPEDTVDDRSIAPKVRQLLQVSRSDTFVVFLTHPYILLSVVVRSTGATR